MKERRNDLYLWLKNSIAGIILYGAVAGSVTSSIPRQPSPVHPPSSEAPEKPVKKLPEPLPARGRQDLTESAPDVLPDGEWVDSMLAGMTIDEKIGQLLMPGTYSNRTETEYRQVERMISEYHLGGLLFFQGGPVRQAALTNRYQALSKVPLLISIDAEWGLGMRLDSTVSFPRQMTLGAIENNRLIYEMGLEIGRQCRRIGVHVNFAPVVDINTNPGNPVIGSRSFGESRENVTRKAVAFMKGLQHQSVIAVAKHFPGHGDTDADSHHTLPVVRRPQSELTASELYPYRQLIRDSLTAVLSAHLHVPDLDSTHTQASSLSREIISGLLRRKMGFRGLVFTDAMNMKGVLKAGKAQDINFMALLAGNDILLAPESIPETITKIKEELQKGTIDQRFIDAKVRRILQAKYFAGLNRYTPVDLESLYEDLYSAHATGLRDQLSQAAVTVVSNTPELLPVKDTRENMASLSIGDGNGTVFQKTIDRYATVRHFNYYATGRTGKEMAEMTGYLAPYPTVLIALHLKSHRSAAGAQLIQTAADMINQLRINGKKTILCVFGSPYSLEKLPATDALICANQNDASVQETAGQIIYGAIQPTGKLPVSAGLFKPGTGIKTPLTERISFGSPESAEVNGVILNRIDYTVKEAITQKAFPGCQVLVAHKGRVIFNRSYGSMIYQQNQPVTSETLYDLASVTKIAATVQAVMLLYDRKAIDLDQKASAYLPELKNTDKQNLTVRDLLIHRSGFISFYPRLWETTMSPQRNLLPLYYKSPGDSTFSMQVSPSVFAKPSLKDSVWKWVVSSPLHSKGSLEGKPVYVYSDLGFLTLQRIVEKVSGTPLDEFVTKNLYAPMGIRGLLFNPLKKVPASEIAPTEQDTRFRGELLRGTVHDQMAAVNGGVAGHAGLFGNSLSLAVLLQMNLWNGKYGGVQYIRPETLSMFTRLQDKHYHRGLGWDKPRSGNAHNYVSEIASDASYGHSGFTGNVVWIDPDKELIYIFLSNRVHPAPGNNRINSLRTRRKIHDIAYEALLRPIPM